jgi:hypothetical protein
MFDERLMHAGVALRYSRARAASDRGVVTSSEAAASSSLVQLLTAAAVSVLGCARPPWQAPPDTDLRRLLAGSHGHFSGSRAAHFIVACGLGCGAAAQRWD